jgi:ATP-dependent DNA helicase RecQ
VVQKDNARKQLTDFLRGHRGEAGIVYCMSRRKVEEPLNSLRPGLQRPALPRRPAAEVRATTSAASCARTAS